jgi:hypothetical protein
MPSWSSWHAASKAAPAAPAPALSGGTARSRWHWSPARWLAAEQAWTAGAWHWLEAPGAGPPPAAAAPEEEDNPWASLQEAPPPAASAPGPPPGSQPGSSGDDTRRGYGDWSPSGWWTRAEWEAWEASRTPAPATAAAGPAESLRLAAVTTPEVAPLADVQQWLAARPQRTLAASARHPESDARTRRQASPGSRGRPTRAPSAAPRGGQGPPGPAPPPAPAAASAAGATARRAIGPPPVPVEGDRLHARTCLSCDAVFGIAYHFTGLYQRDLLCELCGEIEYLRTLVEAYRPSNKERRILRLGVRVLCAQALGSLSEGAQDPTVPPPGAPPVSGAEPSSAASAPAEESGAPAGHEDHSSAASSAATALAGIPGNYRAPPPGWLAQLEQQTAEGRLGVEPRPRPEQREQP